MVLYSTSKTQLLHLLGALSRKGPHRHLGSTDPLPTPPMTLLCNHVHSLTLSLPPGWKVLQEFGDP